jgi:hypothetical protein
MSLAKMGRRFGGRQLMKSSDAPRVVWQTGQSKKCQYIETLNHHHISSISGF